MEEITKHKAKVERNRKWARIAEIEANFVSISLEIARQKLLHVPNVTSAYAVK
jgi:hypothetical protein